MTAELTTVHFAKINLNEIMQTILNYIASLMNSINHSKLDRLFGGVLLRKQNSTGDCHCLLNKKKE